ncbi:MAG: hypothetical protein JSS31_16285 [Proteobacteria bacterium]|nr:hypothetical protein [Pseudomonadota bacterium]MBS0495465.1 hypothetical protein [Pseudomonadota bacterium]
MATVRSVNAFMTASFWEIGRRIVEFEQGGQERAAYGQALLRRLSSDLTARFGHGFGIYNLQQMRLFYQTWPADRIYWTLPNKSAGSGILQALSAEFSDLPKLQTPSGESADT